MVKIIANHNKQEITYSFTIGQTFPTIEGKLISIEVNGQELIKLTQKKEIPICAPDSSYLVWHGRSAGNILKLLREMFSRL